MPINSRIGVHGRYLEILQERRRDTGNGASHPCSHVLSINPQVTTTTGLRSDISIVFCRGLNRFGLGRGRSFALKPVPCLAKRCERQNCERQQPARETMTGQFALSRAVLWQCPSYAVVGIAAAVAFVHSALFSARIASTALAASRSSGLSARALCSSPAHRSICPSRQRARPRSRCNAPAISQSPHDSTASL